MSHAGNHGLYAMIDQMIYRVPGADPTSGISIFARIAGSPSDRNQIDFYADAGLVFTGMIPARPSDVVGIAFAYSRISNDAAGFDRDSGLAIVRNYESVLEISYTAEIAKGWMLQPDLQYFWNPGGNVPDETGLRSVDNATVLGLRTSLSY